MTPRRRRDDAEQAKRDIQTLWKKYAPYWHICMFAITLIGAGCFWYFTVNNAIAQTDKNTADIDNMKQAIAEMRGEMKDIHNWLDPHQNFAGHR